LENLRVGLKRYAETSKGKTLIDEIVAISKIAVQKINPELRKWMDNAARSAVIEIELLPNLGYEQYFEIQKSINEFIRRTKTDWLNNSNKYINSRLEENSAVIRALIDPDILQSVIQGIDSVWQIREAPTIVEGMPQALELKELPIPKAPPEGLATICVLDTGVDSNHPFLKDILLSKIDLTDDDSPEDLKGHGTFVAGLAAYGNLQNRKEPEPSAYIISAKVHGKTNNQLEYLEDRIEEAVKRFHDHAKIFSLSVMYPRCCSIEHPSQLAFTLDRLSHEYNVLFVICSGNVWEDLPALISITPYPTYLGDKTCTLFSGAESCMAVTVGGVARKDSDTSIAKTGQPSPFTRRGEYDKRSKPDVVYNAGNIERDIRENKLLKTDELGVVSLGRSPQTLAYDSGTSYAQPAVANVAARLSKEYPEASPNLLKALLVHFAALPEGYDGLNADTELKNVLYGKGIPEFEKCSRSLNHSPAYIVEDTINYDNEVVQIPIYVPLAMKGIYGAKRMRVTLVYNPPVDRGVTGYTLVDLDFRLLKPKKRKLETKVIDSVEHKVDWIPQYKWAHLFRRTWDNVKTDTYSWQHEGWGTEWVLEVFPRVRFRDNIPDAIPEQPFAVVITLEDPNKKKNLYSAIKAERKRLTKPLEAYAQSLSDLYLLR
jgi:hypothetical protein